MYSQRPTTVGVDYSRIEYKEFHINLWECSMNGYYYIYFPMQVYITKLIYRAHILFKDHKNFQKKKLARLINPTKTELGLVSKDLMQRITSRFLNNPIYDL